MYRFLPEWLRGLPISFQNKPTKHPPFQSTSSINKSGCPQSATAAPYTENTADKLYLEAKIQLRQKRREKRLAKGLSVSDDEEPDVELEEDKPFDKKCSPAC